MTDCRSHLVLAAVPGRGPGSDLRQFRAALRDAAGRARIGTLLADADFDAGWVHEQMRKDYGIRTIIPPERGRPSDKPPAGRWRRWMKTQFARFKAKYGQRWQTEVMHFNAKQMMGLEGPSNRTPQAVERTAPVGLVQYGLTLVWFHRDGHQSVSFPERPWYPGKEEPSYADILTTLRRESWRGQFEGADWNEGGEEAPLGRLIEFISRAA